MVVVAVSGLGAELDREGRSWECILVFDGVRGGAWTRAQELVAVYGDRLQTIAFQNAFGESMCLSAASERARGRRAARPRQPRGRQGARRSERAPRGA